MVAWPRLRYQPFIRGSTPASAARGTLLALPEGRLVEPTGKRRVDVILAWALDPERPIDEHRLRARWPDCESIRKLGEGLFLLVGVEIEQAKPAGLPEAASEIGNTPSADPRRLAEQALSTANQGGDPRAEVMALSDLGFIALSDGDATGAVPYLERALMLAREIGDRSKIAELSGNLGVAGGWKRA